MRFLGFLSLISVLSAVGCSSSINAGGDGGDAGGTTTATTTSSGTTTTTTTGSGGAPPSCDDPPSPAAFEVGYGQECFERLTSGQEVKVMEGPQGGYHIWLAVGCADCGTQAILEYGIIDPTTGTWVEGTYANQAMVPLDTNGWGQIAGLINRLPGVPWDETTKLPKGTHVIISGAVLDSASKKVHEAQIEVVLGETEYWSPPCDENEMTCGAPGGLPCCSFG